MLHSRGTLSCQFARPNDSSNAVAVSRTEREQLILQSRGVLLPAVAVCSQFPTARFYIARVISLYIRLHRSSTLTRAIFTVLMSRHRYFRVSYAGGRGGDDDDGGGTASDASIDVRGTSVFAMLHVERTRVTYRDGPLLNLSDLMGRVAARERCTRRPLPLVLSFILTGDTCASRRRVRIFANISMPSLSVSRRLTHCRQSLERDPVVKRR